MKPTILHDKPAYIGGAEMTMAEFGEACPVDLVEFEEADTVILGNVIQLGPGWVKDFQDKRIVWYHNDLSPWINPELKLWLNENAEHIFCSPLQRDKYGVDGHVIPPAMDLSGFKPPRNNGVKREGTCSIAQWRNPGKGSHLLAEWAAQNGKVNVFGDGEFLPTGKNIELLGPLSQEGIARTLWRHKTFVFLPFEIEPFCRSVVEAWTAGCQIVTNGLVGALYYINEAPEKLESAASDFWKVVTE